MLQQDEQLELSTAQERADVPSQRKGDLDKLYERIENMVREREEKEQKRMNQLLVAISEQLNKNVVALFEGVIQKEIRGPLTQKIEKIVNSRIDYKIKEMSNVCSTALVSAVEGKALAQTISKTIKAGIVEGIVPVVENGMNEIRLQILDRMKAMPMCVEKFEDDLSESKDDTFDIMVDTLKDCDDHIEEHPKDVIIHLLETDIAECFTYVIGSKDPEIFLFLLNKLPPDAEIDMPNGLLVQFIQQMILFIGAGWRQASLRSRYTIFLSNALSHIQRDKLTEEDLNILRDSILNLLKGCPAFGGSPNERHMLGLMQEMGLY
ncbi:hypothetical protein NEIG_00208 [Nematocida sp. ERTm5]|nr:hypothetical protein NEIG_00208 [Nematocida sp. ERTm5]